MPKKQRRAGATETFSVSVDPATKAALRALAESDFGGNMSAAVTDLAADARRRMAAAAYLRRHGLPKLTGSETEALQATLEAEFAASRGSKKRKTG